MTDDNKQDIPSELQDALSQQIEDQVEEEIAERMPYVSRFRQYFIAVGIAIMTLGQFSEAVTLIEAGLDWASSKVTHTVEYKLLSKVRVGNTESYIEELLGSAQVSRSVEGDIVANYFYDEKYLLTVFLQDSRVVAYTIVPLKNDFTPVIVESDGEDWLLQDDTFSSFPANPKMYMIDHSKTISYYLETLDSGRAGLFNKNYLGRVSLGVSGPSTSLVELNRQEITGSDQQILAVQSQLRSDTYPNLYGAGTLDLEVIQQSLLTSAEFSSYFGR